MINSLKPRHVTALLHLYNNGEGMVVKEMHFVSRGGLGGLYITLNELVDTGYLFLSHIRNYTGEGRKWVISYSITEKGIDCIEEEKWKKFRNNSKWWKKFE